MTLVVLQYPLVLAAFALCAASCILTAHVRRQSNIWMILSGLLAGAAVVCALIFSVPLSEILLLLGVLLLILFICTAGEEIQ